MIDLDKLGYEFRQIRVEHGVTLQDIANVTGHSRKTIWDFEHGHDDSAKIVCAYILVIKPTPAELERIVNEVCGQ